MTSVIHPLNAAFEAAKLETFEFNFWRHTV